MTSFFNSLANNSENIQFFGFGMDDTLYVNGVAVGIISEGDTTLFESEEENNLPFSFEDPSSTGQGNNGHPLYLDDPSNVQGDVEYDPLTGQYTLTQKVGGFDYRDPEVMEFDDYWEYDFNSRMKDYWLERQRAERFNDPGENKLLNFDFNTPGSEFVDIKPQGTAELIFGVKVNKNENPALAERDRTQTNFDFDMKIQMNVVGTIGDKLKLTTNYNTESTFDFENQMKLEYVGDEDEIIKKIEAGNVTLPLNSSLIQGSQSLFGIKSEMQFGRLTMTSVFSQQKGETETIEVSGGAMRKEFEIRADQYEANKHFFLTHKFKDAYDDAMASLPFVNSPIQITNIEVWSTNTSFGNVENARNILAFTDLGTANVSQILDGNISINAQVPLPDNDANDLYADMESSNARDFNQITGIMAQRGYEEGVHYNKIENARKLSPSEYTVNPLLGYISLNRSLNTDEVLGVAIQYTYNGEVYQIGDLTTQSNDLEANEAIFLKLLKSTQVNNTQIPLWELMMKNVYALGEYNIQQTSFQLDILYMDPERGNLINYIPEESVNPKLFIQITNCDRLNVQHDAIADGIYDFVDGYTINASNGRIYFPVREPFGEHMREVINNNEIADFYAFDSLYTVAQNNAQIEYPNKNRFYIRGSYESSSSSEISLNAMNVPEGSVIVTAGGVQLTENVDYTVDYMLGRVKIINEGVLNSGTPIKISLESNSLFAVQSKTMLGTHLDYQVNKDLTFGGTLLNLTERPMTFKVNIGDEPISNTVVGLSTNYRAEAPYMTKLVDMIPFIDTKEKSTIAVTGEYARLIPGSSRAIKENGGGVSFIDDFEGAQTVIDLRSQQAWILASTPQDDILFPEGLLINNLASGFNRAKLAWYVIDPLFNGESTVTPSHIKDDPDHRNNNYVRGVLETEISPNKQLPNNTPANLAVLDLAYYPEERGPYNYDVDGTDPIDGSLISAGVDSDGNLNDPASRWGGVMRRIETIDFETSNIEFVELWLMDPFNEDYNEIHDGYDVSNHTGGDFYLHLGNISEDILRDSRKSFENGMPTDGTTDLVDETPWGRVPSVPALVNAFDNDPNSRPSQDIGLDGLSTTDEKEYFAEVFLDRVAAAYGTNSSAYAKALNDPSSDDYHYFRGSDYDAAEVPIHERYKKFNGYEGNSPTDEQSPESYQTSATTLPNVEDINMDQTLSESESYYEYKISLRPEDMVVGENYITQVLDATSASGKEVKWYQLKIPVKYPDRRIGNIQDFRSIRFMRMLMKDFDQPVICRLGRVQLVRGEWRRYEFSLMNDGEYIPNDELGNTTFDISAVNIEDNAAKTPVPYVLPPGVIRETNVGSTNQNKQNEQSLLLRPCGLQDGDSRAVFKNTDIDVRSYGRIKMYTHAEAGDATELLDNEVTAFIRLGSDFDQNYYEYEIPLTITPNGTSSSDAETIWPESNHFDIPFTRLTNAKTLRDIAGAASTGVYTYQVDTTINGEFKTHNISVKGTPNLANIRVIMLGVRNPVNDGYDKCVEVWFNELRLTDFDESGGWAATASVTSKLADFGQVSLSGFMSTPGWGSIEKKVSERSRETVQQFDGSASVELGKFFPEKTGIRVPVYASYSKTMQKPQFNPLDPDVQFTDDAIYDSLRETSLNLNERRSINFSNVKKVRTNSNKKPKIYDVENLNMSYTYNEVYRRDINTEFNTTKNYRAALNYDYNYKPKNIAPFRKTPLLKNLQRHIIDNYTESEKGLKEEIQILRKADPRADSVKIKEEELNELREKKKNFQKWSNSALRSPWLRPIKDFNFYYMPSKLSVRTDANRMYNESKMRNTTDYEILLDTNYNKNFAMNRVYALKFDLAKGLNLDFTATNQARIDEPEGRIDEEWERDSLRMNLYNFGRTTQYHQKFDLNYKIPINKFPITDWITASARYSAEYTWTAAALAIQDLGNTIQNSNSIQLSGQANLVNFYNKIDYLKELNREAQKNQRTNRLQRDGRDTPKSNETEKDTTDKEDVNYLKEVLDQSLKTIMMLRNVSVTYNKTNGMFLPGFTPNSQILGNDLNKMAPGLGFVFGQQENARDFQDRVWNNGWLTGDTTLNTMFRSTYRESYNGRATLEPFPKLRVELTANRDFTQSRSEFFRAGSEGTYNIFTPTVTGSYSSTVVTWNTAFETVNDGNGYNSDAFNQFLNNRNIIAKNLANNNEILGDEVLDSTDYPVGYGAEHQDVLVLAFLSAYTGRNPSSITNPFIAIPKPNWRINYNGLTSIPAISKYVNSIQLSHAYRSSFTIGSFTNNLYYDYDDLQNNFNGTDNVQSENLFNTVTITEQFAPLMKVDMKWNNNLITKVEMKKDRNMSLNMASRRVQETRGREIVIGTGYVFKGVEMKLPVPGGSSKKIKSDLDVRVDLSIRNNLTITRQLDGVVQPTAGQRMVTLKTSADYKISERLIVRAFFDRVLNDPVISNSFRNSNSNGGISVRFNLAQ